MKQITLMFHRCWRNIVVNGKGAIRAFSGQEHALHRNSFFWSLDADTSTLLHVGGVDISFIKGDDENACACLVVLSFPALEVTLYFISCCGFYVL